MIKSSLIRTKKFILPEILNPVILRFKFFMVRQNPRLTRRASVQP